jgi:hypothetical protein
MCSLALCTANALDSANTPLLLLLLLLLLRL